MSLIDLTCSQWLLIFAIFIGFLYRLLTWNNDFFKKRGIKFLNPYPLFGNMGPVVFRTNSFPGMFVDFYNKFPKEKFIGVFEFLKPIYMIRDPELIKQVMIKDFDHFVNHRLQIDDDVEPVFGRSLFLMKDQKWRDMRATLSPAFTGSKMRQMFTLMIDCSKDSASYIYENASNEPVVLEMKDFCTRFTNDVIATCAFGIKTESLKDRENEFYIMGKALTNLTALQSLKFFGYSSFPKLMKFLKISIFERKIQNFFRNLVHGAMKYREEHNIIRPDMINLLLQAQQGSLKHEESDKKFETNDGFAIVEESEVGKSNTTIRKWTDDDLTAQCLLFFLAGFDTVANLMCFLSVELAANQDVQKKLLDEIDEVNAELDGKPVTYEILQKMKYMDMTISECLRRWPAAIFLDRYCNSPTTIKDIDDREIQINVGDGFWFPVFAIHNDPKHYQNPNKFDPERFSDENKHNIKPFTYLPFGLGPRNCIGSRFALIEAKALFFELLSNMTIEMSPKSHYPIILEKAVFNLRAKNGFWVQFRKREK